MSPVACLVALICLAAGSAPAAPARLTGAHDLCAPITQPTNAPAKVARVKTTGYCSCGECCSWRRSWFGLGPAVIASGPGRGRPKEVGVTAARTRARPGVIAADTSLFPFGTVLEIPGYGWGRVEDVGGAIKGYHLDLYFDSHAEAQRWGVRKKLIRFWRPPGAQPKGVRLVPMSVLTPGR
jgi:3D (Asp-Asp-Asp) domain-containing protein